MDFPPASFLQLHFTLLASCHLELIVILNEVKDLYGSNYKDPVDGWRKYFDEKTLADYVIIKEFVGDLDGYTSTYLYKRRGCEKLFFGPIWDCDKGWNNDKRVPHYEYQPLESLMIHAGVWMPPYVSNDWFQRLSGQTLQRVESESIGNLFRPL